jgi:hypothetical protein
MEDNIQLNMDLGEICGKKVIGKFDGGKLSSDGGAIFLSRIEEKVGIIDRLCNAIIDRRDSRYIDHSLKELVSQRIYQIACNYEDANDCNTFRSDPVLKAVCGRLPEGSDLGSQPTMTRLENAPRRTELYRMGLAFVDNYTASYPTPPQGIILDMDDTCDPTHGSQQLSLFNTYYDEQCYMPLHMYDGKSGKLIVTVLRPGKRAKGVEIVAIVKRVVKQIRKQWPKVEIILRGDSHFSVPELHSWCLTNSVHFVFGQTGNAVLLKNGKTLLEQAELLHKESGKKIRLFKSFEYQANSWDQPLRVIQKAEVTEKGSNPRFVVTSFESGRASFIYDTVYCGRGNMENYIKEHKTHLHSDRTSCTKFEANQLRLFLHGAAYVLMHTLREVGLKGTELAKAQFNTIQNKILKIGTRVEELVTKVRFHFPTNYPFKGIIRALCKNLVFSTA